MNEIKCPKCNNNYHPEHEPHDCDTIKEHGSCVECLGYCPYCRFNIFNKGDSSFNAHTSNIEEFLEEFNEENNTNYFSIEEFNSREEYYWIEENEKIPHS